MVLEWKFNWLFSRRTGYKDLDEGIAALANPKGHDQGSETVLLLLNSTPEPIDLTGWTLADKNKNKNPQKGVIKAGDVRRVDLSGEDWWCPIRAGSSVYWTKRG